MDDTRHVNHPDSPEAPRCEVCDEPMAWHHLFETFICAEEDAHDAEEVARQVTDGN